MKKYLTGKFIVSAPHVESDVFDKAVILVCAHDEKGAMGIVINQAVEELNLDEILSKLNLSMDLRSGGMRVLVGGPVDGGRGFVLHTPEYSKRLTGFISDLAGLTSSADILTDIATGRGPQKTLLALGYAGWSPGQLEQEIKDGLWLVCDGDDRILFDIDLDKKWEAAMSKIRIDQRRFVDNHGLA